jgi:hypothetical protein
MEWDDEKENQKDFDSFHSLPIIRISLRLFQEWGRPIKCHPISSVCIIYF